MKNFLLALMVVLTTCTLAVAQNQNPVAHDSISQAEPTLVVDTDTTDSRMLLLRTQVIIAFCTAYPMRWRMF